MARALFQTLRKGSTLIHVSYAGTFSNNLYARDFKLRVDPTVALSIDLEANLRTQNKDAGSYLDAVELAQGAIDDLELVQVANQQVLGRLRKALSACEVAPRDWHLTVILNQRHSFHVEPRYREGSLFLRVVGRAGGQSENR